MAIQSASAKLYTGIRCWCVDKNISASLTAPFTIVANVRRLKRTYIDLFSTAAVSLTDQRYKIYGGGNVVNDGFFVSGQSYKILELGDSDWNSIAGTTGATYVAGTEFIAANNGALPEVAGAANDENATTPDLRNATRKTGRASLSSWTARSTVVCDFPTYIRIDIEKLGLPEGTDCIVQFEENWIVEDRGRLLPSGTYEYPNNVQELGIPRNDNYVQFRTPWFGVAKLNSAFTRNFVPLRIKQLSASFPQALGSIVFRISYNRGNFASLFFPIFSITPNAVKTAIGSATLLSSSVISSLTRFRLRYFASDINIVSTLSNQTKRIRFGVSSLITPAEITASGERTIGPITASIASAITMIANAVKITNIIETEPIIASMSTTPTKIAGLLSQNLQSTSSLSGDGSVPMVFTWTVDTANQRKSLPVYYGNINAKVAWGDGSTTTHTTPGLAPNYDGGVTSANVGIGHNYSTPGTYTVTITGLIENWGFTSASQWDDSRNFNMHFNNIYQIKVASWGYIGLKTLVGAHSNLLYQPVADRAVPSRLPPTVTDISYMFQHTYVNTIAANWDRNYINNWDVSNVQNMSFTFYRCRGAFNTNLGSWNVGNVQNFYAMFYFASDFIGNGLTGWNVGSATNMGYMFYNSSINVDLPNWNVSNCQNFQRMFHFTGINGNAPFNGKLTYWNLSSAPNADALEGMLFGSGDVQNNELCYRRDLTYWCVPNVPTRPLNFNTTLGSFNTKTPGEPYWGTCPGNRPIVSSVSVNDVDTDEGQTITLTVNVSNVANTTIYYRFNNDYIGNWQYPSGGVDAEDPNANTEPNDLNIWTGSIAIVNGVGTLSITIQDNDNIVEITEYFRIDILSRDVYVTPTSVNDFLLGASPVISIAP